jgi:peroxiredoxin
MSYRNVLCCPPGEIAQVRPTILIQLLAVTVVACASRPVVVEERRGPSVIGRQVDLRLPSLDGDEVDLAQLRGKPLVVHFSTTGSLNSQIDVEELRRVRAARRGLQVVEIALDPTPPRLIRAWADASKIDWLVLLAAPGLVSGATAFGPLQVTPTTFLLDAQGKIVWGHEGGLPRGALAKVLGELDARGA